MAKIPSQLQEAAEQVHKTNKAKMVKVRDLLSWFGAQRRGVIVISDVRKSLKRAKLITVPDFEVAYIDQKIKLKPVEVVHEKEPISTVVVQETQPVITESVAPAVVGGSIPDPAPRIGMLKAANSSPLTISRDTELSKAIALMLLHDYSQLPVMQGDRQVDGLISWRSIGRTRIDKNAEYKLVRDCMDNVEIVRWDMHLFDAVKVIADKQVVLVRNSEGKIGGLVTTSDISLQFVSLSEPFLLVSEIENHIRRLIDGKFSLDQLKAARDPNDATRKIENVANLTFGEYVRLLESPDNWEKLGYELSGAECVKRLRQVGRIRNDVMHFHPDGISPQDLELLRETRKFLQSLR
jgi:CBS domain-containing protein